MGNEQEKKFVFKVAKFEHTSKSNNKKRAWRSLKQIITMERALVWPDDAVLCKLSTPKVFAHAD